jgi:hypothetical protein
MKARGPDLDRWPKWADDKVGISKMRQRIDDSDPGTGIDQRVGRDGQISGGREIFPNEPTRRRHRSERDERLIGTVAARNRVVFRQRKLILPEPPQSRGRYEYLTIFSSLCA